LSILIFISIVSSPGFIHSSGSWLEDKFQASAATYVFHRGVSCLYNISRGFGLMVEGVGQFVNESFSKWIREHSGDIFWSDLGEDGKLYCYDILYSKGYLPPPQGLENTPLGRNISFGNRQGSGPGKIMVLASLVFRF